MFDEYINQRDAVYKIIASKKKDFINVMVACSICCLIAILMSVIVFGKNPLFITTILVIMTISINIVNIGILILLIGYLKFLSTRQTKKITKIEITNMAELDNKVQTIKNNYNLFGVYENNGQYLMEFIPIDWRRESILALISKESLLSSENSAIFSKMIAHVKRRGPLLKQVNTQYIIERVMYINGRSN